MKQKVLLSLFSPSFTSCYCFVVVITSAFVNFLNLKRNRFSVFTFKEVNEVRDGPTRKRFCSLFAFTGKQQHITTKTNKHESKQKRITKYPSFIPIPLHLLPPLLPFPSFFVIIIVVLFLLCRYPDTACSCSLPS